MMSSTLNAAWFSFLNMGTLAERTEEILRDHPELNGSSLAALCGVTKGLISHWRSGEVKTMKDEAAQRLNRRYGYAMRWLLLGDPPKYDVARVSDVEPTELPFAGEEHPVVGYVMGGDRGYYDELAYSTGHGDGYVRYPTRDRNTYALRVRGDSMRPRLQPGEYVVVAPNHPPAFGDEVVVRTTDDRVMVKKLGPTRGGVIELTSINETDHPPISIEEKDVVFIHYVAGVAKDYLYRTAM